jgi:hypothetical protein
MAIVRTVLGIRMRRTLAAARRNVASVVSLG